MVSRLFCQRAQVFLHFMSSYCILQPKEQIIYANIDTVYKAG
jgi:hypothetical protein